MNAVQFDLVAGFDLSSLPSATQAQIMQAINQIAPLSNVGGVIVGAGSSAGAALQGNGTEGPNVTNNPRWVNYVWINTYGGVAGILYTWNPATSRWNSAAIAAGSIVDAMIATGTITLAKLANGTAGYLIRCNGSGVPTFVSAASALVGGDNVPVAALNPNGSNAILASTGSSNPAWITDATLAGRVVSNISDNTLPVAKLVTGTAGYFLVMSGGVPTWVAMDSAVVAAGRLALGSIVQGGASANQVMSWNGSTWAPATLSILSATSSSGILSGLDIGNALHTIPHLLGAKPKIVQVYLRCVSNDAGTGYVANDEITLPTVTGTNGHGQFGVYFDATNVYVSQYTTGAANMNFVPKAGGAVANPSSVANWKPVIYAWI